ncbi:hypothetical protein [Bacillus sp. Marseille-Q1617]|uniref:hypothetical protein n=1 Tax=Bacillus sp. Marseille-Q1617 TaxID=2736887 RepID=UPI001588C4CB|nr:hypothetical protein [Bacillus sp. Marseille-Q1617]
MNRKKCAFISILSVMFLIGLAFYIMIPPQTPMMNEKANEIHSVSISFWKDSYEMTYEKPQAVNTFVSASERARKMEKVITTEPLLRYEYISTDNKVKNYHLWLSQDQKGYIQSLLPGEDTNTYELSGQSVEKLKDFLHETHKNRELPEKIEFE